MWSNGRDTNEDGESILLLLPTVVGKNKRSTKNTNSSSSSSHIGGQPTYHNDDTPKNNIKCTNCNKLMYLLLQLHAPIDDFDRTLYVFGCNNSSCYSSSTREGKAELDCDASSTIDGFKPCIGVGPLRCFRSQKSWTKTPANTTATSVTQAPSSSSATATATAKKNDWGMDDDDDGSDGWGDNDGNDDDWGMSDGNADSTDKDISMNDLENMLTKCEMQYTTSKSKTIQHQQQEVTKEVPKNDIKSNRNDSVTAPSFDHHNLDMVNEPPQTGKANHSDEEEEEDDDDDDYGSSDITSSKVDDMVARYLDTIEDNEEIISALKGGECNAGSNKNDTCGGGNGGGGERFERLPPDERALLAFSKRLKRMPSQVVRYAYGGVPLWSIPLPPSSANNDRHTHGSSSKKKSQKKKKVAHKPFPTVKNCTCGASRLFEFQLLPSILHVLNVDEYAAKDSKEKKSDDAMDLILEGGMNWENCAVYSCSESCDKSREEFIIMQAALCDAPMKKHTMENDDDDDDECMNDN